MTNNSPPAVSYISTITGVREVALTGTADLTYWREQLRSVNLVPYDEGGRAAVLITAIDSKFRGIPFRELSISVVVSDDGGTTIGGAYLAQAFNSSRLLAFAERAFFRTPYHLAELAVDERIPVRLAVSAGGMELFNARMGSEKAALRHEDVILDSPIYLPGGRDVFYARLNGMGDVYAFDASDTVTIRPNAPDDIFARLVDSGFAGREWLARAGAVHARSRTFARTDSSTNS